jgi:hypothetical protein
MINKLLLISTLYLGLNSCQKLNNENINLYIDSKQYGWYILYLEQDSNEIFEDKTIFLDEKNKRYARLKLKNIKDYKINVYDYYSNKLVSNQMKMISYSGKIDSSITYSFYNPNSILLHDTVFNPGRNKDKIRLYSELRRIKDSISNLND